MRISELLGLRVRTESGHSLGNVHDVRAELTAHRLRVTGLVVGGLGILERLGLGAPRAQARLRGTDVVSWTRIVRVDRRGVIVRDDTRQQNGGRS
jgi:sporulation protein YlmC with PRC-barrel domain